jgi:hypothetical protein
MMRSVLACLAVLSALLVVVLVFEPWQDQGAGRIELNGPDEPGSDAGHGDVAPPTDGSGMDATLGQDGRPDGTAPTLAAEVQHETQRQPAAVASRDIEIVVTCGGRPLEGAHVVIAPVLHDPLWDAASEPHSWEREELRGAFTPFVELASLLTDVNGVCAVPREDLVTMERAIVIGVLHERAFGEVRAIQVPDLPATDRIDIALDEAEPARAIVRGAAEGAPVEVGQSALYGNFRAIEGYTDEWVSRPLLRWAHKRTGSGPVPLFPVRDRCLVTARAGDAMAPAFVGTIAGEVEFELGPTFQVEGRTIDLDQPMIEALVRVLAFDPAANRWIERGVGAMSTDGTFEAFDVAWLEGATQWQARAEATDRYTVVAALSPSPGARSFVEFDAPNGVRYEVRVVDGLTDERIPGARVTIDWPGRVDPPWTEMTIENGEAMFAHLPIGMRISIDVEAAGYAKEPTDIRTTESITDLRAWVIPVFPTCRVQGHIAPAVSGLETLHAVLERVAPVSTRGQHFDVEVVNGAFEFEGLGGESASLLLHNERGTAGPIAITQGAGVIDIGTLEFVPYASARARVIDAVTGAPIANAEVAVRMDDGTPESVTLGEVTTADDLGVVRIERFPGDGAWLKVDAPGSATAWATDATFDGSTYDFGDVVLQPQRLFEVELGGAPRRPHRFRLAEWVEPPRSVDFDEAGRARVPIEAYAQRVQLVDPEGRVEVFRAIGWLSEVPQPFTWQVPPGRLLLRVVGADESYEQYLVEHLLTVSWFDGAGWYERTVPFTCRAGALPTRRVPAPNVSFRITDGDYRLVRWGRADLATSGDQELVIDLGGDIATLRVVDADGAPLGGVYVRGFDRRYPSARYSSSVGNFDTDANGEAWVPLIEGGALGLALLGPNDEIMPDVDTTGWRAGALQEVVLAPKGAFEVVVRAATGNDSAVAGATVGLYTSDERMRLTSWTTDDEGRLSRPLIEPATYLLEVTRAGHWWRKLPLEVTAEPSAKLEVLLPELARLELRLVDASGAPLANTGVELLHEGLDEFHSEWLATGRVSAAAVTDVAGRLALDGVPAGTYVVGVDGYEVGAAVTGDAMTTIAVR